MATLLTLGTILVLLLFAALAGVCALLWNGTRQAVAFLTSQLDERAARVAELEAQIDSLHAKGIPIDTVSERDTGPEHQESLPKEIEDSIEREIEDEAARQDFRERARFVLAERPHASTDEVLADLYTS